MIHAEQLFSIEDYTLLITVKKCIQETIFILITTKPQCTFSTDKVEQSLTNQ